MTLPTPNEQADELRHILESAWQDGFGCATRSGYRKRTDEHMARVNDIIAQHTKEAVLKARIDEVRQMPLIEELDGHKIKRISELGLELAAGEQKRGEDEKD